MDILKRIDFIRHSKQFQKSFDVIMWLNRYHKYTGHDIDEKHLFSECNYHMNSTIFNKILAGNPWIDLRVYSDLIHHIHLLCDEFMYPYVNKSTENDTYIIICVYKPHNSNYMNSQIDVMGSWC